MGIRKAYLNLEKLRREVAGRRMGAEIARDLGVANNTVNRWLTGKTELTLERFNLICEKIGVDVDEFLKIERAA